MNNKILLTIGAIVVVIAAAIIYVVTRPAESTPVQDSATSSTQETAPQTQEPQSPEAQPGLYTDYSEEAVATTSGTKLLFFHASWCTQCRQVESSIAADGIPAGVTVFKVDYDSNQALRQQYGVTLQTTFVKIDDDGNKIDSYVAYDEPTIGAVARELLQ